MKYFMLVLCIALVAFGDSFLSIAKANTNEYTTDSAGDTVETVNIFTTSMLDSFIYTYLMILGDWDTSSFGTVSTVLVWIFFLLCTIFNMIVMLNLLISIISETFA